MPWMIVVIFFTLLDTLSSEVACISLADIYWNATNPIFRIDNTDHIIDVNKNRLPFEYDQVNIICPVYPHSNVGTKADQGEEDDEESEQYIIYNVSKEEYDSCRITNPNPRVIAVCDKPNKLMYFTITFRSFTPQPGGLEFLPGHDYYFVSTSTGGLAGLHQLVGGRCATHNMKVIFKVCCSPTKDNPSGSSTSSHQTSTVNVSLPATSIPPSQPKNINVNSSVVTKSSSTSAIPVTSIPRWIRPTSHYMRPYEVPIEDEMDKSRPSDKNKEEVEKVPKRDRTKKDELVNSATLPLRWSTHHGAYFCVTLCLLYHFVSLLCR